MNPNNLKVGDIVIYDYNIYSSFLSFLYNKKHIVTEIKKGVIYTKGYNWSYSDYLDGCPNELKTSDVDLQRAIISCGKEHAWTGSNLVFNFIHS